jgi:hypothetical protein
MSVINAARAKVAAVRLEAVVNDLSGRGFAASMEPGSPYPRARVINREVPQLSEHIYAAADGDGVWWFWWSWADRLAPVDDVETAAFKVAYVLTPRG